MSFTNTHKKLLQATLHKFGIVTEVPAIVKELLYMHVVKLRKLLFAIFLFLSDLCIALAFSGRLSPAKKTLKRRPHCRGILDEHMDSRIFQHHLHSFSTHLPCPPAL